MKGWISLHRQIQENWLWTSNEPFDMRSAWIDLLLLANHEDVKAVKGKTIVTFKRGTVNLSVSALADRWKWSRGKARRYIELLKSDGMITVDSTTNGTTITIVNYSVFQDLRPTDDTTNGQPVVQRTDTNNNDKQLLINNKRARARGNRFLDFFQRADDLNSLLAEEAHEKTNPVGSS